MSSKLRLEKNMQLLKFIPGSKKRSQKRDKSYVVQLFDEILNLGAKMFVCTPSTISFKKIHLCSKVRMQGLKIKIKKSCTKHGDKNKNKSSNIYLFSRRTNRECHSIQRTKTFTTRKRKFTLNNIRLTIVSFKIPNKYHRI